MFSAEVTDDYIKLIDKMQRMLCRKISNYDIAIETNPSSNKLISTFRRYDQHPVLRMYNRHLIPENKEEAQLFVSINTDDLGVFSTTLENEFNLMSRALEVQKNADGSDRYSRAAIRDWVNDIREMGLAQSFLKEN